MQAKKYSIKHWAAEERPREKLILRTAMLLTDSELLAVIIRNGTRDQTAVDLARNILQSTHNNLQELARVSVADLMRVRGIGQAKAASIAAALELGRRRQGIRPLEKPVIKESREVAGFLQAALQDQREEVFAVLFLNRANKINHFEILSRGGLTGTVADPRIILRKALEQEAVSLILCHNHPSGNLQPSRADEQLTAKIREAAGLLDIRVLDHIIVSAEGHFSFADSGLL
jgi:DNA repair protein RadC